MQQAELALSLAVDDLRGLQKEWDAAKEREAALSAELEERRGAIEAAEKAVEELQERIPPGDARCWRPCRGATGRQRRPWSASTRRP